MKKYTPKTMVALRLMFLVIGINLSGCAMMLISDDKPPPDLKLLSVGMHRNLVEKELGQPISEIRPDFKTGAAKRCEYQFLVKTAVKDDRSFGEKVNDAMLGFRQVVVTIHYDGRGHVMRLESHEGKKEKRKNGISL